MKQSPEAGKAKEGKSKREGMEVKALLAMLSPEAREEMERTQWENRDTDIVYDGTKIILPASPSPMSLYAARDAIDRKIDEENTMLNMVEQIPGYPYDAAVAFVKAMKEIYGWASSVPTPGFFGPQNPDLITVKTGPGHLDSIQVPMGSFRIPGIENAIQVHFALDHSEGQKRKPALCIHAETRKREQHIVRELVAKAKEIMARDSIYRGKALRLKVTSDGAIDFNMEPIFLDTSHISMDELILSREIEEQIDTSVFTLIRHTAAVKSARIPLKRGVLLSGRYGTGKTLTSRITSKVCTDNGWTFIALDDAKGLKEALEFAKRYQPAVVFAEDIDRVTEERDDKTNDLLNMIDGILSKDSEVIMILTTNHIEHINPAMLRPGRLDAIVMVEPPDAEAAQRLIRMYGRGLIGNDEPLNGIGEFIAGQIPATIREVVERSKLSMINKGRQRIIEEDLMIAARGMMPHLNLLNKTIEADVSPERQIGEAMAKIVSDNASTLKNGEIKKIADAVAVRLDQ